MVSSVLDKNRIELQPMKILCLRTFSFPLVLPVLAGGVEVQVRPEMHPVKTVTLTVQQTLLGGKGGRPALVAGQLHIPAGTHGRMPAVILLPGGNGLTKSDEHWADEINSIGVATFLLDSFSGRGVDPDSEQSEVNVLTMLVDAYRALGILAKNPRLDPNRIAVMGFSMGGGAAIYASNERFRRMYAPPGEQFAAHIGLYTPCYWNYRDDDHLTGKPVRLFHGIADDWVPIGPCREYVQRAQRTGADITITEYEDAYHGYANLDTSTPAHPVWLPEADALRNCKLVEGEGGIVFNTETGKPFHLQHDPCFVKGAHAGRNPAAALATVRAVKEFLGATFQLK
jgi:dienelactone hydrolase